MPSQDELAAVFEGERPQLLALARRMLRSHQEAEDVVQDAWLRLARTDSGAVDNLAGWLRTVVSRLALDVLRSGRARREVARPTDDLDDLDRLVATGPGGRPDDDAVLTDAATRALSVVLERLGPAERVAVVLHDVFGMPFEELADVLGRSTAATKQLASRGRRRVRGGADTDVAGSAGQGRVVERFLDAARRGDLETVLDVLAPDAVRRADPALLPAGAPSVVRGAEAVARGTMVLGARAAWAHPMLVDGRVGAVVAPRGRPVLVLTFTVVAGRIAAYEAVADPGRIAGFELTLLDADRTFGAVRALQSG